LLSLLLACDGLYFVFVCLDFVHRSSRSIEIVRNVKEKYKAQHFVRCSVFYKDVVSSFQIVYTLSVMFKLVVMYRVV